MGLATEPVWRLVDIRWVFPDAAAATRYDEASMQKNAEGLTEFGSGAMPRSKSFRGSTVVPPQHQGVLQPQLQYIVLFVHGSVVAKLYVCQGPQSQRKPEYVQHIMALMDRVGVKIGAPP